MNTKSQIEDESADSVSAQLLYDRSRAAGTELVKHFSALATAAVGVFFVALSTKVDPPLTSDQRSAVVLALSLMLLTLIGSILGWLADSLFYESWARHASGKDPETNWRTRE